RRRVRRAALVARIAVLIGRLANWTGSLHEPIGQKRTGHWIEELADVLFDNQSRLSQGRPKLPAQLAIFRRVRAAIVVEFDLKAGEISAVLVPHPANERFLADAGPLGADHDRRAVRVVGTHIDAAVADQL